MNQRIKHQDTLLPLDRMLYCWKLSFGIGNQRKMRDGYVKFFTTAYSCYYNER
jgi:hypothetical protein